MKKIIDSLCLKSVVGWLKSGPLGPVGGGGGVQMHPSHPLPTGLEFVLPNFSGERNLTHCTQICMFQFNLPGKICNQTIWNWEISTFCPTTTCTFFKIISQFSVVSEKKLSPSKWSLVNAQQRKTIGETKSERTWTERRQKVKVEGQCPFFFQDLFLNFCILCVPKFLKLSVGTKPNWVLNLQTIFLLFSG